MARTAMAVEDWSDLTTFKDVGAKLGQPLITINPHRTITFNSSFMHHARQQLEGQTHVILSYSKKNSAIVFEFTDDPSEDGTIKITRRGNVNFAARSFFNWNFIDISVAKGKYIPKLVNIPKKGNCWMIQLLKKTRFNSHSN